MEPWPLRVWEIADADVPIFQNKPPLKPCKTKTGCVQIFFLKMFLIFVEEKQVLLKVLWYTELPDLSRQVLTCHLRRFHPLIQPLLPRNNVWVLCLGNIVGRFIGTVFLKLRNSFSPRLRHRKTQLPLKWTGENHGMDLLMWSIMVNTGVPVGKNAWFIQVNTSLPLSTRWPWKKITFCVKFVTLKWLLCTQIEIMTD